MAQTGVSDVTVGRVLEDFEERGWVVETDECYRRTRPQTATMKPDKVALRDEYGG